MRVNEGWKSQSPYFTLWHLSFSSSPTAPAWAVRKCSATFDLRWRDYWFCWYREKELFQEGVCDLETDHFVFVSPSKGKLYKISHMTATRWAKAKMSRRIHLKVVRLKRWQFPRAERCLSGFVLVHCLVCYIRWPVMSALKCRITQ